MNGKKRYKLAFKYENRLIELPILNEETTNCFLTKIDLFTLDFNNEFELLIYYKDYLEEKGYNINFGKITIVYKADKEIKYLEPIFSDETYLKEYALNTETNISIDKTKKIYNKILKYLEDEEFIKFLVSNNLYNKRITNNVEQLKETKKSYFENELLKELSRYKALRGILKGVELYKNKDNNKENKKIFKINDLSNFTDREEVIYHGRYSDNHILEIFDLDDLDEDLISVVTNSKKIKNDSIKYY